MSAETGMHTEELENIEIDLLLEALHRRWGYDFRGYARSSVGRRVRQLQARLGVPTIAALIPQVLHDQDVFGEIVRSFSISVTEMFRDPWVYRSLRENVVPMLRTWPFIKVWHAGCASGEELYSLAILLQEEGLHPRATLYGTDFSDEALDRARLGIYPADRIQTYTRNYAEAGGKRSFSEYYHARYDSAVLDGALTSRTVWANHNLAMDAVFGETHLILCRNVLIYFGRALQDRVLGLFTESLVHGGFLCLGAKESLQFTAFGDSFEVIDERARIYRKKAP